MVTVGALIAKVGAPIAKVEALITKHDTLTSKVDALIADSLDNTRIGRFTLLKLRLTPLYRNLTFL